MWIPSLISENSNRFPPSIHVNDDAFGNIRCASPPSTGTSHMSKGVAVPYAIRDPSGDNVGHTAESVKNVICCQAVFAGVVGRAVRYHQIPPVAVSSNAIATSE